MKSYIEILKSGTIVVIGSTIANLVNYGFAIFMTRLLSPSDYASLTVLAAIIMLISLPLHAITTLAAKYPVIFLEQYTAYTKRMMFLGIGIALLYLSVYPFLEQLLEIPPTSLLILLPIILLLPLLFAQIGIAQGTRHVWLFSSIPIVETVVKCIVGVVLVYLGYALNGVILAISMSITISTLIYVTTLCRKRIPTHSNINIHLPEEWKQIVSIIIVAHIAVALLGNMDLFAAKYYLSIDLAAQFSALMTLSKVMTYLPLILLPIIFPVMSQTKNTVDVNALLKKGMVITACIAGAFLVIFKLAPTHIIALLPSQHYGAIAPYLFYAGTAAMFGSFVQLLVAYFIAVHNKRFIAPLVIWAIIQALGLTMYNNSIPVLLTVTNITNATLLCILFLLFIKSNHVKSHP